MKALFLTLFIIDAALHLAACLPLPRQRHTLRCVTKVLLIPLLAGCYWFFAAAPSRVILFALACGWLGDVLLIFSGKTAFFAAGLAAFAAGHILYIVYFLGHLGVRPSLLLCAIAVLVYTGLIVLSIYMQAQYFPPVLAVPCCGYAALISLMSLSALLFAASNAGAAPVFVCIGSVLFMLSDSVLSFVTFRKSFALGNFSVMITYILAQIYCVWLRGVRRRVNHWNWPF